MKKVLKRNIVAASKRGRSHAHEGKARDDDLISIIMIVMAGTL